MLFDRGVISGAVYNNDPRIAEDYKFLLKDMNVLHIFVSCDMEDYMKFQKVRGITGDSANSQLAEYLDYNERYKEFFRISGVPFITYHNKFNCTLAKELLNSCGGCGHYSYGVCRHPIQNGTPVDPLQKRCKFSKDKEVQDDK